MRIIVTGLKTRVAVARLKTRVAVARLNMPVVMSWVLMPLRIFSETIIPDGVLSPIMMASFPPMKMFQPN